MLFAVVKLRSKGRRLSRTEVAAQPRAVGELVFCAPPQPRDPLKRPTKIAELLGEEIGGIEHTIIASPMEPFVVTVTRAEIVLFGFELATVDGAVHEHAEGWLVRHVAEGERRMRRGEVPMQDRAEFNPRRGNMTLEDRLNHIEAQVIATGWPCTLCQTFPEVKGRLSQLADNAFSQGLAMPQTDLQLDQIRSLLKIWRKN